LGDNDTLLDNLLRKSVFPTVCGDVVTKGDGEAMLAASAEQGTGVLGLIGNEPGVDNL